MSRLPCSCTVISSHQYFGSSKETLTCGSPVIKIPAFILSYNGYRVQRLLFKLCVRVLLLVPRESRSTNAQDSYFIYRLIMLYNHTKELNTEKLMVRYLSANPRTVIIEDSTLCFGR